MMRCFLILVIWLVAVGIATAEPKPEPQECPWIRFETCPSDPDWQMISQKKGELPNKEARYIKLFDGFFIIPSEEPR